MKKTIAIAAAAAAALCWAATAQARGGIIGGFTSSKASIRNFDMKSVSQYHVGLTYQQKLFAGLSIQPSILYQVKGASLGGVIDGTEKVSVDTKMSYIEVPVAVQWGPDLLIARPYLFLEPFLGYAVNSSVKYEGKTEKNNWLDGAIHRMEYGLGIGAGIDLVKRLQVSLQYFWNFGHLAGEDGSVDGSSIWSTYKTAYKKGNFNGVKVSAAIFF